MVGEDKSAFVAASSAVAAYGHPARGKGRLRSFETFHPARAMAGRGRDDQISSKFIALLHFGDGDSGHHFDPDFAVDFGEGVDCAVQVDDAIGELFEFGEDALRFAEGVAEEQGGAGLVAFPPFVDFLGGEFAAVPVVDRKAKGGFGDKAVAFYDFEGFAGGIGVALVVAGDAPDFVFVLYANLGGAKDMSGGVEGNPGVVDFEAIAISNPTQVNILT